MFNKIDYNCFIIFQCYYLNIKILKFDENIDLFCDLIGRLETKSRLWLDNAETPYRPPEALARWTHSEVQPRKYSEKQNSLSFNNIVDII